MTPRPHQQQRSRPSRRIFAWYVGFADRHNLPLLGALFLLMIVTLGFASRLELHTDLAELLPDKHPAVLALRRIAGRQKSATNLVMLIHSPSAEANHKFAAALAPRLAAMVPTTFSEVQWKADTEVPEFARKQRWLYAKIKELEDAESLLDRIIAKRGQPGFVDLEGDPDEELKELRGNARKAAARRQRRAVGLLRRRHPRRALHRRHAVAAARRLRHRGRARGQASASRRR